MIYAPQRTYWPSSSKRIYAIAASLILHLALITPLLWHPPMQSKILAPSKVNIDSFEDEKLAEPEKDAQRCLKKPFVGIGISLDLDDVIISAPHAYPAFRAGLRVGDAVLNSEDLEPDARGYETVHFIRASIVRTRRIKTERICG